MTITVRLLTAASAGVTNLKMLDQVPTCLLGHEILPPEVFLIEKELLVLETLAFY